MKMNKIGWLLALALLLFVVALVYLGKGKNGQPTEVGNLSSVQQDPSFASDQIIAPEEAFIAQTSSVGGECTVSGSFSDLTLLEDEVYDASEHGTAYRFVEETNYTPDGPPAWYITGPGTCHCWVNAFNGEPLFADYCLIEGPW